MLFIGKIDIADCSGNFFDGGNDCGTTFIFRIPRINYYFAFLVHYLIVLAASWIFLRPIYKTYYGVNYQFNFESLLFIAAIYLIIQLVIRFMQINDVQRVNRRLKQTAKEKSLIFQRR